MTDESGDRPTDEEILAFSQSIQDEAVQDVPLISPPAPLIALLSEYANGNPLIRDKITHLATTTTTSVGKEETTYCRTRGDGNCFYRAFATALLLNESIPRDTLTRRMYDSCTTLDAAGFSRIVYEDFLDSTVSLVHGSTSLEAVMNGMNDAEISNAAVVFLRFLTSAYIKSHGDTYAAYLLDGEVLTDWCERWVEAMGSEADNIQINALVNALGVTVQVVHLDGSVTPDGRVSVVSVVPDQEGHSLGTVKVLYRPGHYDVLM